MEENSWAKWTKRSRIFEEVGVGNFVAQWKADRVRAGFLIERYTKILRLMRDIVQECPKLARTIQA
jgi:hypothetical protein